MKYRNVQMKWMMLLSALTLLSACSKSSFDAGMATQETQANDPNELSLDMSKLTVNSDHVADGMTPADITLDLRTRMGAPVEGIVMTLEVSGSGNVIVPCTASNASGHSRCKIFSTIAELKSIKAVGRITLTGWTRFEEIQPYRSAFAVVSGADSETLVTGQRLVSSLGTVETPGTRVDSFGIRRVQSSIMGPIAAE